MSAPSSPLVSSPLHPDDPLAPVLAEVAREAASVREAAADLKAALGATRLVDQKAADDLVRRLAASADATAKATARAEVRDGVRRTSGWLAGAGLALLLCGAACGFAWGRASAPDAPACPAERVRESGGARWCLLATGR